ncbi:MAG: hypothetical protein LUI85_02700 [Bacteroides sp.]|nr:hypothetical protein [Bacteroides sp.]
MTDLNQLRDRVYKRVSEYGFHDEELSNEHLLCLVISELIEAVKAYRTECHANKDEFEVWIDGHDGSNEAFIHAFNKYLKYTVSDGLAYASIRLFDLAGLRNLNLNRFALVNVVSKKKASQRIYMP